ncbi:FAD dependent oxidoreductase [Rickenella mellea]|uniref:FAD dependent oxidoreductase n=1 Tax=Rickenella mellea TaxID=50990 RepID=A0A4Y7QM02_9AGAM|nr:FAD dependent oxidoreductase [Rickenella mellea]
MQKQQKPIVVLGAGVIGLSIAYTLSSEPSNKISIVARDMPEHHLDSQGWASPWAGANWSPIGGFDERTYKWETLTFNKLWDMVPTGLVMHLPSRVYHEDPQALSSIWWKDIVRNFRVLPSEDLPPGVGLGLAFTTISTKPARYLRWMKTELVSRGVEFISKSVGSIEEAAALGGTDSIVINATGLVSSHCAAHSVVGSRSLLGVEDLNVYPIRGQTTIVEAPHVKTCVSVVSNALFQSSEEATYIIPRPDGSVILGGTFQSDNWNTSVDHKVVRRIFERCTALQPDLLPSRGTTILSHNVGLRPARKGGPRVEIETIQLPLSSNFVPSHGEGERQARALTVIHAYGFGPAGYQNSWGVASEVAELVASL